MNWHQVSCKSFGRKRSLTSLAYCNPVSAFWLSMRRAWNGLKETSGTLVRPSIDLSLLFTWHHHGEWIDRFRSKEKTTKKGAPVCNNIFDTFLRSDAIRLPFYLSTGAQFVSHQGSAWLASLVELKAPCICKLLLVAVLFWCLSPDPFWVFCGRPTGAVQHRRNCQQTYGKGFMPFIHWRANRPLRRHPLDIPGIRQSTL